MKGREGFPIGLTIAAAIGVAICAGLGVWQLQRNDFKQRELARFTALKTAPAQPIGPVLARLAKGDDVELTRVAADCAPAGPQMLFRMSSADMEWVARPMAVCRLDSTPYDGVMVDRGIWNATRGSTSVPTAALPSPGHLVGLLRAPPPGVGFMGLAHPAPLILVVESETPALAGVTPAPGADKAPENLQYVGAYAPTWFGLAGVLACVYAAMLWRRRNPKR